MKELPKLQAIDRRQTIGGFQPNLFLSRRFDVLVEFVIDSGQHRDVVLREFKRFTEDSETAF